MVVFRVPAAAQAQESAASPSPNVVVLHTGDIRFHPRMLMLADGEGGGDGGGDGNSTGGGGGGGSDSEDTDDDAALAGTWASARPRPSPTLRALAERGSEPSMTALATRAASLRAVLEGVVHERRRSEGVVTQCELVVRKGGDLFTTRLQDYRMLPIGFR